MLTVKKTKKTITMSVAAGEEGGKLAADDVSPHAKHGTISVAAGEEDGLLAVTDHWEVEHRAHEAGSDEDLQRHLDPPVRKVASSWMLERAMLPLTPNMVP